MGPIGSAVLTFIGYKQTNRQAKFIYRLGFQGASRTSSISTFNCGSIYEHLLFVQYKTIKKIVRGFNDIFERIFQIFTKKQELIDTNFCNFDHA